MPRRNSLPGAYRPLPSQGEFGAEAALDELTLVNVRVENLIEAYGAAPASQPTDAFTGEPLSAEELKTAVYDLLGKQQQQSEFRTMAIENLHDELRARPDDEAGDEAGGEPDAEADAMRDERGAKRSRRSTPSLCCAGVTESKGRLKGL